MVYLVEFHEITKILLTLREITKKITKNFQLPNLVTLLVTLTELFIKYCLCELATNQNLS